MVPKNKVIVTTLYIESKKMPNLMEQQKKKRRKSKSNGLIE